MSTTHYKHPDTPKRARVLASISANKNSIIPRTNNAIFKDCGVSKSAGYRILKSNEPRTFYHAHSFEPRGRLPKISKKQAQDMVDYVEIEGFNARTQNYCQLAISAGITTTTSLSTIRRALPHQYRKHLAAVQKYIPPNLQKQRLL